LWNLSYTKSAGCRSSIIYADHLFLTHPFADRYPSTTDTNRSEAIADIVTNYSTTIAHTNYSSLAYPAARNSLI